MTVMYELGQGKVSLALLRDMLVLPKESKGG
jgi:hypothetical protein